MSDAKKYNKPIEELRWELIAHRKESAKIRRTGENARCGCVGWNSSFEGCAVYQNISKARAALIALSKAILEDAKPKMYSGENPPWKIETTTTEPKVGAATIRSGGGSTIPWGPEGVLYSNPNIQGFIGNQVVWAAGRKPAPESFAKGTSARVGLRKPAKWKVSTNPITGQQSFIGPQPGPGEKIPGMNPGDFLWSTSEPEPAPKIDLKNTKIWWNPPIADPTAPTVSELMKGVPLSGVLGSWASDGLGPVRWLWIKELQDAVKKGQRVHIEYTNAEGDITDREIVPFALRYGKEPLYRQTADMTADQVYIDAYCILRDRKRMFRLDRIKALELVW